MIPSQDAKQTSKQSADAGLQESYLSPEFLIARESFWTPTDGRNVFIGCGDDRAPTAASIEELMKHQPNTTLNPAKGYASVFGATAGLAKNTLVTGVAQFGNQFVTDVDGFFGVMKLLIENSKDPQALHSGESNEQNQRHFSMEGAAPIGCAYAAGIGATAELLVGSSSAIRNAARAEQGFVFGSDDKFDDLLRGQQAFLDLATNQMGEEFSLGRKHYIHYKEVFGDKLHIMILRGSHTSVKSTGVISNFSLEEVGSSVIAHEKGLDFYRLDIAVATDAVLKALTKPLAAINSEYVLSPELLIRSFQLDATPVRAVLASSDKDPELSNKLDPLSLKMGVRGNPFDAIKALITRQQIDFYS